MHQLLRYNKQNWSKCAI